MKIKKLNSQRGVSLMETIIVLAMLSIITALVVTQIGRSKGDFQRQRIARELKVYLERARFDSVKRRAVNAADMSKVILNSATSFTAIVDFNENGIIDSTDQKQVNFSQHSNTRIIVADVFNYPVTISFNQRGHITAVDALNNAVNPIFTVCSNNCSDMSQTNNELSIISVSTTGTIAVLKNIQSATTLPTPVVTSSPPIYNCYALVGGANRSGCLNN